MATLIPIKPRSWLALLAGGFSVPWATTLLILAINSGFAAMMSIEDPRPFWHPFITAQCFGLAIAYSVNAASPWDKTHPVWRLVLAVAIGSTMGYALIVLIKGYILAQPGYTLYEMVSDPHKISTLPSGFAIGLLVSLFFLLKFRESRAKAALHRAEAERYLLAKGTAESELKLMQAQVEPHFLFNTLASVQYLIETDAPRAGRLLGHLLSYLRAALPQLRTASATLGEELKLAEAYLNVLEMRMGPRLAYDIAVPEELRVHPFPPALLITIVENAVTHGLEPQAEGGSIRIEARRNGEQLQVSVADTGRGLAGGSARPGGGVGLSNVRDRLAAMFGARGRFTLEDVAPHGARATIEVPFVI